MNSTLHIHTMHKNTSKLSASYNRIVLQTRILLLHQLLTAISFYENRRQQRHTIDRTVSK